MSVHPMSSGLLTLRQTLDGVLLPGLRGPLLGDLRVLGPEVRSLGPTSERHTTMMRLVGANG